MTAETFVDQMLGDCNCVVMKICGLCQYLWLDSRVKWSNIDRFFTVFFCIH